MAPKIRMLFLKLELKLEHVRAKHSAECEFIRYVGVTVSEHYVSW